MLQLFGVCFWLLCLLSIFSWFDVQVSFGVMKISGLRMGRIYFLQAKLLLKKLDI